MLSRIDVGMIGRMAVGWARGRFRYGHPSEMKQVANEVLYGYVTHYAIGVSLALPYVLGWDLLVGGPASPIWALAYGVATTVAAYFFVLPSMGLGVFGRLSPEGIRGCLPKALGFLFPAWPTTYSMEWVLRSGSHWYEYWESIKRRADYAPAYTRLEQTRQTRRTIQTGQLYGESYRDYMERAPRYFLFF